MITREDLIEQSVTDYVRAAVFVDRNYPASQVELRESFPYDMTPEQFSRNIIAIGFNFDNQGEQAELGSDLKRRLYTLQFFVFGKTATYARNLANVLKFALEQDGQIPLKDIAQTGGPVIDYLDVIGVNAERQIIPDPEPWQEHVWTTTVRVEDLYHAALV